MPCMNGGTCVDVVGSGFTCTCPSGFTGPECETGTAPFRGMALPVTAYVHSFVMGINDFALQVVVGSDLHVCSFILNY